MKNFDAKLKALLTGAYNSIEKNVSEMGTDSEVGEKTVVIDQDQLMFNIGSRRCIKELGPRKFYDNEGLAYNITYLDSEHLMKLADYIGDKHKAWKKQPEPIEKSYFLIGNEAVKAWSEGLEEFREFWEDNGMWETFEYSGLNSDLPDLLQAIEHKSWVFLSSEEYEYFNENF